MDGPWGWILLHDSLFPFSFATIIFLFFVLTANCILGVGDLHTLYFSVVLHVAEYQSMLQPHCIYL